MNNKIDRLKYIALDILKEYHKDFMFKYIENIKDEKIRSNSKRLFDKKINNFKKMIDDI
jgi:hypothetical protein